jgi:cellulose synthase/poly-beta-1,6-N-acetylglucosamine synthase-like glycosyltransferase
MRLPFVSIIVPAYNCEKIIAECIPSLLNQNYPKNKYEVVVVDNNSKDKTSEIVKSFSVKYLFETIQSSYAARNKGIKHAKGKIITFTDADCIASKNWLKDGIKAFNDKSIGCVGGQVKSYKPKNYVEEYLANKKDLSLKFSDKLPYPKTANAFYRKEVFDKIGLFEQKWVSGGDADLAWRMQSETDYKVKLAPNAIVYHKHRSDIKSLFKQCIRWGVGNSLLRKKYPDLVNNYDLRQKLWVFQKFLLSAPIIFAFLVSNKKSMTKKELTKRLDIITFMGWEFGKVIGRIIK